MKSSTHWQKVEEAVSRVRDRRGFSEWMVSQRVTAATDQDAFWILASVLTPLLVFLSDGYKRGTLQARAWVLLYAIRPDLVDGESLTDYGAKNGITRQSVQTQLEYFKAAFPHLEMDFISRRGKDIRPEQRREWVRRTRAAQKLGRVA